jgi:hypothetical protein
MIGPALTLADLGPDADPVAMIQAADAQRLAAARALQRTAARKALVAGNLAEVAGLAGRRVTTLERWARRPEERSCARNHPRSEHGDYSSGRWRCLKCEAEARPRAPNKSKMTPEQRRSKSRLRAAWAAHERRLAEREALASTDDAIPERLRSPLPPPGTPPQRR